MTIFVDTAYWVARLDKRDQWRSQAKEAMNQLSAVRLVTTELVLVEVLNYFSRYRVEMRQEAAAIVQSLLESSTIEVVWQTPELFTAVFTTIRYRGCGGNAPTQGFHPCTPYPDSTKSAVS